jgi:uncharacterized SAM-binding protein YcdF (DUF218 family)
LGNRRPRLLGCLGLSLLCVAILCFARGVWLPWIGEWLVKAAPPVKADAALVIGGDYSGNRILKGAELERQGYVPKVFVSGNDGMYGNYECDLAIRFAEEHGYPESYFVRLPNRAMSTREEASAVVPELRRYGVHTLDLVTSETHTRRAGGVYREIARSMDVHVVAAPEPLFRPDRWWQVREGRKAVVLEWAKTFANWFHL